MQKITYNRIRNIVNAKVSKIKQNPAHYKALLTECSRPAIAFAGVYLGLNAAGRLASHLTGDSTLEQLVNSWSPFLATGLATGAAANSSNNKLELGSYIGTLFSSCLAYLAIKNTDPNISKFFEAQQINVLERPGSFIFELGLIYTAGNFFYLLLGKNRN